MDRDRRGEEKAERIAVKPAFASPLPLDESRKRSMRREEIKREGREGRKDQREGREDLKKERED